MAQGVRAQVARTTRRAAGFGIFAATAWLGALAGCGDDERSAMPPPRAVDSAALAASAVPGAVLDECHGPRGGLLRSSPDAMDRLNVTVDLPGGERLQVYVHLPDALRMSAAAGDAFLLAGGRGFALGEPPRAATAAETELLGDVLELVDRAALGPLRRATAATRTTPAAPAGADGFTLVEPDGSEIALVLMPGSLLPARVGAVTIDDYLRTPVAWIPRRATHPRLGRCELLFEDSAVAWRPDFFAPPGAAGDQTPADVPPRIKFVPDPIGSRSSAPVIEEVRAARWLLLADPGDWQERARRYGPLEAMLEAQNQQIAGFPVLTRIDGEAVMAVPFRQRPGGPAAKLPEDAKTRAFDAGRELVVYPHDGDLEARCAAGTAALQAELAAQRLEAIGPIACQPYVHLQEGPPSAAKLADPVVRVSVRIR